MVVGLGFSWSLGICHKMPFLHAPVKWVFVTPEDTNCDGDLVISFYLSPESKHVNYMEGDRTHRVWFVAVYNLSIPDKLATEPFLP